MARYPSYYGPDKLTIIRSVFDSSLLWGPLLAATDISGRIKSSNYDTLTSAYCALICAFYDFTGPSYSQIQNWIVHNTSHVVDAVVAAHGAAVTQSAQNTEPVIKKTSGAKRASDSDLTPKVSKRARKDRRPAKALATRPLVDPRHGNNPLPLNPKPDAFNRTPDHPRSSQFVAGASELELPANQPTSELHEEDKSVLNAKPHLRDRSNSAGLDLLKSEANGKEVNGLCRTTV